MATASTLPRGLEPLAPPGGVCVASIVNESVGNRINVAFQDGGEVTVKNIERPVRVWKWHPDHEAAADDPAPATAQTGQAKQEQPSIAVLPFDNMSGDPEQAYFSDGITEDIITDLSKVAGLMVIARNSSFAYKGKAIDIRTVGRELGVRSVLEAPSAAPAAGSGSTPSSSMPPPAGTCGRTATTATSRTSSRCRTKSLATSSRR